MHKVDIFAVLTASIMPSVMAFVPVKSQSYQLTQDYSGQNFFDNFDFYTGADPTNGHVQYVNKTTANSTSLAGFLIQTDTDLQAPPVYLGVDYTTPSTSDGRPSTRVSSKQTFNHSLIIADIMHMPAPVCGTWPAYWLLGSHPTAPWPAGGEVDILENINNAVTNKYTLHTTAGIKVSNYTGTAQTGRLDTDNCDINAPNQPRNAGCTVSEDPSIPSYGDTFNDNDGGLFATLIDADGIRIWFFPRDSVPADISTGTPNPPSHSMVGPGANSTWPLPNARFDGPGNDMDSHFRDMRIIFNIAFCGDWAGSQSAWEGSGCAAGTGMTRCEDFVTEYPDVFTDVWWGVNSVRVFELLDDGATTPYVNGTQV